MDTWERGTDENFLTTTHLTRYDEVFSIFFRYRDIYCVREHHQVLGLLLRFYKGSMQRDSLCNEFGVPPSTLARVLKSAEDALGAIVKRFCPGSNFLAYASSTESSRSFDSPPPTSIAVHMGLLGRQKLQTIYFFHTATSLFNFVFLSYSSTRCSSLVIRTYRIPNNTAGCKSSS
ncbi:hypothetical protein JG688_00007500 [Phytophthora aleatoria]|uniref:Uncharacterized protein n=1 Tax=Phytophthora aleatoria TaxID=2496075 RepID=A0A8J5J7X4_9STRA|nr:hypothetical protein JG688_00007500 [Phytophthora aleatoria]